MEDKRAGRSTYRPSSYSELVQDAVAAVVAAMGDGLNRLEVEFPAVSNVDGAWLAGCPHLAVCSLQPWAAHLRVHRRTNAHRHVSASCQYRGRLLCRPFVNC